MMYTGARIGEVCQLRLEDIEALGKYNVIHFRHKPELGQTLKHANKKLMKSNGDVKRIVPVHPDLVKLGFLRLVEDMKSLGEVKLFPKEKRTNGRSGVLMAKKVKTFLKGCIGRDTDKSAHCFRHSFICWFNQHVNLSSSQDRIFKAMVGHTTEGESIGPDITWDVYGGNITIQQMMELIKKLDYDLSETS